MKNKCSLGDFLAFLRIKKGIRKGKDFAKLMGITPGFLSKIENGGARVTPKRLSAYAKVLSVEPVHILECLFKENHPESSISEEVWTKFRPVIKDLLLVLQGHYHE